MSRLPLVAGLALAVSGAAGCGFPNTSDIDYMEHQPKFKPYRGSSFFADKRAMRSPPSDTVSQEHDFGNPVGPMPDGGVPTGMVNNPEPVTAANLDLGQAKFNQVCAVCHGYVADGDSIVARKMSIRPPPSLLGEDIKTKSDGYLFNCITDGYGYMNPYREQLTSHERWAVIQYIRALQLSQGIAAASLTPQELSQVRAPKKAAEGEGAEHGEGGNHE